MSPTTAPPVGSLLEQVLAEQADLSAVERFSAGHDAGLLPDTGRWQSLLPATPPGPGQQYAFDVDLDACTGCKACVTACRSLNGLDVDESFRRVGLLHGGPAAGASLQYVTAACHHCLEPGCLTGCPVDAYEKDPITGIVAHLDDQCIGCGYCTFTCPYEVPRFNHARGIVRKCDLCAGRLAEGEAPACAQACPNEAIRVVLVDTAVVAAAAALPGAALVPGAAPSALSLPTTRYRSARPAPAGAFPADRFAAIPSEAHPPLAVMLVLTQLSVGAFGVDLALRTLAGPRLAHDLRPANAVAALVLGLLALGASVLHLGRPHLAWRSVIGLRHSWLSREIVAFGLFAALAVADAAALATGGPGALSDGLGVAVALAGAAGVACSVMIYGVTGRAWWRTSLVAGRFSLTTAGCGLAATLAVSLAVAALHPGSRAGGAGQDVAFPLALALAVVMVVKLGFEALLLQQGQRPGSPVAASARLLVGPHLGGMTRLRFALGALGGVAGPLLVAVVAAGQEPSLGLAAVLAAGAAAAVTAGELLERTGFFAAAVSPAMPRELP